MNGAHLIRPINASCIIHNVQCALTSKCHIWILDTPGIMEGPGDSGLVYLKDVYYVSYNLLFISITKHLRLK